MRTRDALAIGIKLGRLQRTLDAWEESKHPRANNGQFSHSAGGGGSTGGKAPKDSGSGKTLKGQEAVKKVASLKPGAVIELTTVVPRRDGTKKTVKGEYTLKHKRYPIGSCLAWVKTKGDHYQGDFGWNEDTLKSAFGNDDDTTVNVIKE